MAEREVIINKARVNFEGVIDVKGVISFVKDYAATKQYLFIEKAHTESQTKEGKYIELDVELFKKLTDYARSSIILKVQFKRLVPKTIERDNKKIKLFEGEVQFVIDGTLLTDYEARWEVKPTLYVIRNIFERYVYVPYISGFKEVVKEDTTMLIENLKSLLNLQKF